MSVETQGSDYLIVKYSTTLTAGIDFPIDRRLVFDVIGGGSGGNAGGHGFYDYQPATGTTTRYQGNGAMGGRSGEHRTYSYEKNTFTNGQQVVITIGQGGFGAIAIPSNNAQRDNRYRDGIRGSDGTNTTVLIGGTTYLEATGGQAPSIIVTSYGVQSGIGTSGISGWSIAVPFSNTSPELYKGGIGGAGGTPTGTSGNLNNNIGIAGTNGGLGCGGGGGGGGTCALSAQLAYGGGNGGNGGNGFVSIRWGEYGAISYNKEIFQPSFFSYSQDICECFYAHMQQKMLALSSYKNDFIGSYEDAIKATNGESLYTTVNGRQCYLSIGDIGTALVNGGNNAQRVSDFLVNIGYTSTDISNMASITARADIAGIRVDFAKSTSFRAIDLQFIADEMFDYFQRNQITKISISHRENAYAKMQMGIPTVGVSLLESPVNAYTATTGDVKYSPYFTNGQYSYAPESYYSELNNLVFKKEDGTVVQVHDSVRKASLAMILISSNNFVTPIGTPIAESIFVVNAEINGVVMHEDFRINIIPNFGVIEFPNYSMGAELDTETNKKQDILNYVISGNTYKPVFCNLVWNSRDYFLSEQGSGILQYSSSGTYIDVIKMRDENILDILYTFSQIMTLTVVEEKEESFWKTVISGIMSVVIFVLTAYIAPILNLPSQVISTALSYAWNLIMPSTTLIADLNMIGTYSVSTVNDSEKDDTSTSVNFFDEESVKVKNMYNPYIGIKKENESEYKQYSKEGIMWQQ